MVDKMDGEHLTEKCPNSLRFRPLNLRQLEVSIVSRQFDQTDETVKE